LRQRQTFAFRSIDLGDLHDIRHAKQPQSLHLPGPITVVRRRTRVADRTEGAVGREWLAVLSGVVISYDLSRNGGRFLVIYNWRNIEVHVGIPPSGITLHGVNVVGLQNRDALASRQIMPPTNDLHAIVCCRPILG
jgi:hypothetical protein